MHVRSDFAALGYAQPVKCPKKCLPVLLSNVEWCSSGQSSSTRSCSTMDIRIEQATSLSTFNLRAFDPTFEISAVVAKPYAQSLAQDRIITTPVPRRSKTYRADDYESTDDEATQIVLVAIDTESRVCGYLEASKAWNGIVSLNDIAIHRLCRRHGIAKKLIYELKVWTKGLGLPAIRAETQDTNVPACAFYRANGFKFGGYDDYLYCGIEAIRGEAALYWYWFADGS